MQENTKEAIAFLKQLHPTEKWNVTIIPVHGKELKSCSGDATDHLQLAKFLDHHIGKSNTYYNVNPLLKLSTKAKKEDVKSIAYLQADLDPRAGEDLQQERTRILNILENPPEGVPTPTYIIDSGGGYQALWALKEPVIVNGDIKLIEDIERYTITLETKLGADSCHNADRILRLPFTVNIPNANKRKKGRREAPTSIIQYTPSAVYDLESAFQQSAPLQSADGSLLGNYKEKAKVNINRDTLAKIESIDDLDEWDVPERIKVIAIQGNDPDKPKEGDNSRSAWVFDFCCGMARCKVPDEVIASILLDASFGISESIVELGSAAEKYAARQIQRAKEFTVDPILQKMNEEFAVISSVGGKPRVIEEQYDDAMAKSFIVQISFPSFRERFINDQIAIKTGNATKYVNKGEYWLRHKERRTYKTIAFRPNGLDGDYYNMWQGFTESPAVTNIDKFLDYTKDVLCNNEETLFNYLMNWCAYAVQHPDEPGHAAIVMQGEEGIGKSFFAHQFGKLWGRHYLAVTDSKHLTGNFNSHLEDTSVVFADEAFFAGDKKHESVLKALITEETLIIEPKGVDAKSARNYIHLLMASNKEWVVPAGPTARRFFVLQVSPKYKGNRNFFAGLAKFMNEGGRAGFLYYLLNRDLSNFEVRDIPQTQGLAAQKLLSLDPMEKWWFEALRRKSINPEGSEWPEFIAKRDVVDSYVDFRDRWSENFNAKGSPERVSRFIKKVYPKMAVALKNITRGEMTNGQWVKSTKRERCYMLPNYEDCQRLFERYMNISEQHMEWDSIDIDAEPKVDDDVPF